MEQFITILATLGVGTWIGSAIKQYLTNKGETDLKRLEYDKNRLEDQDTIKDLQKEVTTLLINMTNLQVKLDEFKKSYYTEKENSTRLLQQLATINVAFDIVYAQLKRIFGDDENNSELLNQLKKHIDNNTNRNVT